MKVLVRTLKGDSLNITIVDNSSVYDLKKSISDLIQHSPDLMKLIFSGKVLEENDKKLSDYNVIDGSSLVAYLQKVNQPTVNPIPHQTNKSSIDDNIVHDQAENNIPENNIFQMFSNLIQQNPQEFLQTILNDPGINQLYQNNPTGFMQILNDPSYIQNVLHIGQQMDLQNNEEGNEDGANEENMSVQIDLTENEMNDVNELVTMGFSFEDCVQYYIAFDKNKELAINALMNDMLDEQN